MTAAPMPGTLTPAAPAHAPQRVIRASQHTVEVVSDPGEGAQKCGQIFGRVSAMMGNGTWTVEIIPAEIQPPPRTPPSPRGTACASAPDR